MSGLSSPASVQMTSNTHVRTHTLHYITFQTHKAHSPLGTRGEGERLLPASGMDPSQTREGGQGCWKEGKGRWGREHVTSSVRAQRGCAGRGWVSALRAVALHRRDPPGRRNMQVCSCSDLLMEHLWPLCGVPRACLSASIPSVQGRKIHTHTHCSGI